MITMIALVAASLFAQAASAQSPYMLRDTTSFPPPREGTARVLVARERFMGQGLKPEFVLVDSMPIGQLPQKAAVTAEIPAGWHRVWLGRGTRAGVWMEFVAGGRYLVRVREEGTETNWKVDLVRDSRDGYADFAVAKGMQLAVATQAGLDAIARDMKKRMPDPKVLATEVEKSKTAAVLPIAVKEVWYLDLMDESDAAQEFEQHTGTLTLDGTTLKYVREDGKIVEVPRSAITSIRYGGHRRNMPNPWIKIGYQENGAEKGVAFAETDRVTATATYNRLFAELEKTMPE
jgi:hypothetical protein